MPGGYTIVYITLHNLTEACAPTSFQQLSCWLYWITACLLDTSWSSVRGREQSGMRPTRTCGQTERGREELCPVPARRIHGGCSKGQGTSWIAANMILGEGMAGI